ncbi:MAG: PIN domain-containing protein [Bacteroidia bacterium]|nr:PIN domain-containing protein [Bacteroidia bacterium]
MNFLIDTNILVRLIRGNLSLVELDRDYKVFFKGNVPLLSVVSIGEIKSIAIRNNWGKKRLMDLRDFMKLFIIADIHAEDITSAYAEIEAFSQGKHPSKKLKQSARNMGKNDLWIAATAAVLGAELLTMDTDFDHLEGEFLKVRQIPLTS